MVMAANVGECVKRISSMNSNQFESHQMGACVREESINEMSIVELSVDRVLLV